MPGKQKATSGMSGKTGARGGKMAKMPAAKKTASAKALNKKSGKSPR